MDFWDFTLSRKFPATTWGDYLRRIKSGEIDQPASIRGWREVLSRMDRLSVEVDRQGGPASMA